MQSIQRQCQGHGIPFFFKQRGGVNKQATGNLREGQENGWRFPHEQALLRLRRIRLDWRGTLRLIEERRGCITLGLRRRKKKMDGMTYDPVDCRSGPGEPVSDQ